MSAISANKLLCVTIITVFAPLFLSHCFFNNFNTSTPVFESNAPVGSSHNKSFGSFAIALAIDTLCCSPPDNWFGNLFACCSNPTSFKISFASFDSFTMSFINYAFSNTVSVGNIL